MKIKKICRGCGNGFMAEINQHRYGMAIFCSKRCYWGHMKISQVGSGNNSWKGHKQARTCKTCGKSFIFNNCKSQVIKGEGKFCSGSCRSIFTTNNNTNKRTKIEILMKKELDARGIIFKEQYPIWQAKTIPDFFIKPNICIYCDGDYWHNREDMKIRDIKQDISLKILGYKVYRFWEHDINISVSNCVDKIVI